MPPDVARRKPTTAHDLGWQDHAACNGQDLNLFFSPEGERKPERDRREAKAKTFCNRCVVRSECLEHAIRRPEKDGWFGGMSADDRARERRNRSRRVSEKPQVTEGAA